MTADECRAYQIEAAGHLCHIAEHAPGCQCNGNQVRIVNALWEMAAQLSTIAAKLGEGKP